MWLPHIDTNTQAMIISTIQVLNIAKHIHPKPESHVCVYYLEIFETKIDAECVCVCVLRRMYTTSIDPQPS